jgi:hypothetical protein
MIKESRLAVVSTPKGPSMRLFPTLLALAVAVLFVPSHSFSQKRSASESWTDSYDTENCRFATTGEHMYFILRPSYQLHFEGVDGKDTTRLVITVLNETQKIGDIETRVVEERESVNGRTIEVSRNYFAICTLTNTVFYFGEDVDIYKHGRVAGHAGAWRAGTNQARAGVMMPGIVLLGSRYYQEIAPGVAMDRAEIVSRSERIETPAGKFTDCLKTVETTPLEPGVREYKVYAPGVGLVRDGDLLLKRYGIQQ